MSFVILSAPSCLLRIPAMTLADRLDFVQAMVTAAVGREVVH